MPNIKNALIFIAIAAVLFLGYIFFFKKDTSTEPNLVTTTTPDNAVAPVDGSTDANAGGDFLSLLLNVKNIKLDDSIFSDPAFNSLVDSTIVLNPDGTEGRPNPFAPIGVDIAPPTTTPATTTPVVPPTTTTPPASTTTTTTTNTTTKTTPPSTPTSSPANPKITPPKN